MRNRSLQHQMRMREVADAITVTSGETHESFNRMRELEAEAAKLMSRAKIVKQKAEELLALQSRLIECQQWTEFGLPSDLEKAEFERIVGREIRS